MRHASFRVRLEAASAGGLFHCLSHALRAAIGKSLLRPGNADTSSSACKPENPKQRANGAQVGFTRATGDVQKAEVT
jgi:hypothetical protein